MVSFKSPLIREHVTLVALRRHGPLPVSRLLVRGSSWRTVMDLFLTGEVEQAGSDERAHMHYRLPEHASERVPGCA